MDNIINCMLHVEWKCAYKMYYVWYTVFVIQCHDIESEGHCKRIPFFIVAEHF